MNKEDIIVIGGIVIACIWLMLYILIEDINKRKIILLVGVIIDVILFLIGKNIGFLLAGIIGGIIFSFIPARSMQKHKNAINEAKGIKNFMAIVVVFFVMILMFMSIAYPNVEIEW